MKSHPSTERIAAYVDGTLRPLARLRVVAHLVWCVDCVELVADVRADLAQAREAKGGEPGE